MALTPDKRKMILEVLGEMLPRPKVVTRDDLGTIRDADVHVSRADPNTGGKDKVVEVRRPDYVTINIAAWEQQQADKRAEREWRRSLDPCKLGLYGPTDDEE
jgi:hypothetical protein